MNAHLSNGQVEDITEHATFSTEDGHLVELVDGSVTGLSPGSAEVSAVVQYLTLPPLGETSGSVTVSDDSISYTSLQITALTDGVFSDVTNHSFID